MNSNLFLTIKDEAVKKEFINNKKYFLRLAESLILATRVIMFIYMTVMFSLDSISLKRYMLYTASMIINAIWIPLSFKYPEQLQKFSAIAIMFTYVTYLLNSASDLPLVGQGIEGSRNLVGVFVTTVISAVFLNTCWMITCAGIFINTFAAITYYTIVFDFPLVPMVI